jgi:hypothetical protein
VSSLQIGRLLLGPPPSFTEPLSDPVASLGGAVVPGQRTAAQFQLQLATWAADGQPDTQAARLIIRRQLRSLLNNSPLKFQAYIYVVWSDDSEQDGWYVPDQGPLTDMTAPVGLATGLWQLAQPWYKAGARRTSREARTVWMKDLRTGLYARDQLGWVYSADFAALPSLALSTLPNGATQAANAVSGQMVAPVALPSGRDGGVCQLCSGQADLAVLSYERLESALNLSDVIVYDRRGQITAPATGPDTSWEEVYGPDYPWSWVTLATPVADCPVLDNGLVRVRYDSGNTPGFRVDVWNGAAYVEQGKMTVTRIGDSTGVCNTWVSAGLVEYTPDRAVISVVLANNADAYSRERVFITVQRGELGVSFEAYPALKTAGTQADVVLQWTPALNAGVADLNQSVCKVDSQGSGSWTPGPAGAAVYAATAGTGAGAGNSGQFGALATLGNANFTTSENWAAILRCPTTYNVIGAYQQTLVVLQAANAILKYSGASATAYGTNTDSYRVLSQNAAGYLQCQVQFAATQAQQVMEAEAMTLGTGTSSTADGAASGGNAATSTRTTDANPHVTQATWPNSFAATYRVFARVKTSASTLNIYAKTGSTTGATVTTTSASYVWLDLGEIVANSTTLEIHCWASAAATVSVDRVEAVLVHDRARTNAIYSGARDSAQSALYDERMLGSIVAR